MSVAKEFTKGLWRDLPPFRLVLGLCPTLFVTKSVENSIGMGAATTFVLLGSNMLVSMLRKSIPSRVRLACYIVIIATFVVIVELLMQATFYPLYLKLGIFTPLIVVNCIILGRAETFASKHGVIESAADGLGIGTGYTISLAILGSIRELIGNGTIYGFHIMGPSYEPFKFMVEAPGAFVCLGLMLGIMNVLSRRIKSS